MSNSLGLVERIFTFLREKSARMGKGGKEKIREIIQAELDHREAYRRKILGETLQFLDEFHVRHH
jgi:hypothetical protein